MAEYIAIKELKNKIDERLERGCLTVCDIAMIRDFFENHMSLGRWDFCKKVYQFAFSRALAVVKDFLNDIPVADVLPENHGYWKPIFCCNGDKRLGMAKDYECSKCGRIVSDATYSRELDYEFCPRCSAKMDRKESTNE